MTQVNTASVGLAAQAHQTKPAGARVKEAAAQFESLLMEQLLRSMRQDGSQGWLGGGEDQSSESLVELAEQQVARALAQSGGFGLSKLAVQGLTPSESQ